MEKSRYLFLGLFFFNLFLHVLISHWRYQPSQFMVMGFTTLMFISWFYSARAIRTASEKTDKPNSLLELFKVLPFYLRLAAYFFLVYALANFILTLEVHTAAGWIDTHPSAQKVRGLSGFWVMFAFLAYVLGEGLKKLAHDDSAVE